MLIDYDPARHVFVAQFSQDFHGDLDAVKTAKFMTTGAPDWIWFAPPPGLPALERIRKNKPASGLTITDAAYAIYEQLAAAKLKNDEIKKLMKKAQKEAKQISIPDAILDEKWWDKESPPPEPFVSPYPPSPPADYECFVCKGPIYGSALDLLEPWPICLWCEKQLDEQTKNNSK
jgi:hypothetical protein